MPPDARIVLPYLPREIDHAKRKAKQLRKEFHTLSLSAAQQATAKAMGFQSWHDFEKAFHEKRGCTLPDDELSLDEKLTRTALQLAVVAQLAVTDEGTAGEFLARWRLTASPREGNWAAWPALNEPPQPDADVDALLEGEFPVVVHDEGQHVLLVCDRSKTAQQLLGDGKRIPPAMHFPGDLQTYLERWRISDAAFLVVYLGHSREESVMLSVRSVNNLIYRVLPHLLTPFVSNTRQQLKLQPGVGDGLRDLLQDQFDKITSSSEPLKMPDARALHIVPDTHVQMDNTPAFGRNVCAMFYATSRVKEDIDAHHEKLATLKPTDLLTSRIVSYENGWLGFQYLLPNRDVLEVFATSKEYRFLPAHIGVMVEDAIETSIKQDKS